MLRQLSLPGLAVFGLVALSGVSGACETFVDMDSGGDARRTSVETDGPCQKVRGVLRGDRASVDVRTAGRGGDLTILSAGGGHDLEIVSVGDRRRGMVFSGLCGRGRGSSRVVLSGDDASDVVVVPCP